MEPLASSPAGGGFPRDFVRTLLADILASGVRVQGIVGLQGTGKSTLSAQLAAEAKAAGKRVAVLSIDDVYLDRPERLRLAAEVDPLLATRGPPGSHDVALACEVLDDLRAGRTVALPCFDKIDDRRLPEAAWPTFSDADLVLFEGWFLKTPPQSAAALAEPLNALEREEDVGGTWRRYCNDALGHHYPPLWQRIEQLLFLQGPGFAVVPDWRWQQEQTLQAREPGRRTMTRPEVERFVQFFERTSRQALRTLPDIAEQTIPLDAARKPLGSSRPGC